MLFGGPSPRPGELYNPYGPPRPPGGNFQNAYARSEAGGARLPPQRQPLPERSIHPTKAQRPTQRSHGYPQYYQSPLPPPPPSHSRTQYSNGRFISPPLSPTNDYYSNRLDSQSDYRPSSSRTRPSAPNTFNMNGDRTRQARQYQSSSDRDYDSRDRYQRDVRQKFNHQSPPPQRGYRPRRPEPEDKDSGSDYEEPAQQNQQGSGEADGSWSWNNLKKTVWGDATTNASQSKNISSRREDDDQVPADPDQEEPQNTIWARIANVGASFQKKFNGDEGYASDASDYQGESHLIRIMKKYHIEKAESAHDLPDWLFTRTELEEAHSGIRDRSMNDPYQNRHRPGCHDSDVDEDGPYDDGPRRGGGGLSDIYESVDQRRTGNHSREVSKQSFDSGYGSSGSRRPKRYDEEPYEKSDDRNPLGRNRLASNNHHHHPPRPISPPRSNRSKSYSNEPSSLRRPPNNHGPPPSSGYSPYRPANGGWSNNMSSSSSNSRANEDRYMNQPRRFDNPPIRTAASGPSPHTTLDYFRPSGQDDRYPTPQVQSRPPFSSSGMRPQRR